MRTQVWIRNFAIVATSCLLAGCMGMGALAPGVTVLDAQTGKTIAHVKDSSLQEGGPWGAHDAMMLLPSDLTDKTFRTVCSGFEEWRAFEFSADGERLGEHSVPPIRVVSWQTGQYAFSPKLDRVVYQDSTDLLLLDLRDKKSTVLLNNPAESVFQAKWIRWVSDNEVVLHISDVGETAYRGGVVSIPLDGGEPRILYQNPNASEVAASSDMKYLAVDLMFGYPEPSQLALIDLATGSQLQIGTFPRNDEGLLSSMAWSPDNKNLAYNRGPDVEVHSLESKKTWVLKHDGNVEDNVFAVGFLDNSRLCFSRLKGDSERTEFRIVDVQSGEMLFSRTFLGGWAWHVFDNGNRIAVQGK